MATTISYFLQKNFSDVIDRQYNPTKDSHEEGAVFYDAEDGKTVSVTCKDTKDTYVLSIRYTDETLAEKTFKNIEKENKFRSTDDDELTL